MKSHIGIFQLAVGLSVVLSLLSFTHAVDSSDLNVSFEFGYKGVVPKSMRLIPVKVKITNKLRNLTGRIEVYQPSTLGHEVTLFQEIRSPAPSTLTFTLYPKVEPLGGIGGYSLESRVVFDDKSIQTFSQSVHAKSDKHPVITAGLPPFFQQHFEKKPSAASPDKVVYCRHSYQFIPYFPIELPTDLFSYDSVHALILNGQLFGQLSSKQLAAMSDYLISGGRIMIYNPDNSQPTRLWLKSLSIDRVSTTGLTSRQVGAGYLIIQPYTSNRDTAFWIDSDNQAMGELFLPEIIYDKGLIYPSSREANATGIIDHFIDNRRDMSYGLPGILWLVIIVLVYCAIIGPLDWYIIKRTGKHWLTWPFFAVSILLFSFVSYWYSQVVQSAPMTSLTINIVNAQHNSPVARGESFMWLHSTGNLEFQIESAKPGTMFGCRESKSGDQSTAAWARIQNKPGGASQIQCRIPVFSSKRFTADWIEKPSFTPELTAGDPLSLRLPPGLAIHSAYLTTTDGIKEAKYDAGTGDVLLNGPFQPWRSVFAVINDRLLDTSTGLPNQQMLQTYLLALSYGGKRLPILLDGSASGINARLSEWESSLNISDSYVPSPRVLFIFFNPEQPLNTYTLNRRIPERIEVNCLRYFLPPN